MRMPLQGLRFPVKNCGNFTGRMTASFRACGQGQGRKAAVVKVAAGSGGG
jgi:hypothetical protein